ncbi:MAG: hypothetical protein ACYCPM_07060 [Acidobacteriaceae bacterium]
MNPPRKPSPTESPLLFEIDDEPLQETLTAWGGVPLMVQAFRSLGVSARVRQHVQIKQRERGYEEATMVESFVVLNAVGGERVDDFQHLRDDAGLKEMLGREIPSPESARQFLNRFHSEEKLEQARDGRKPEQIAFIPEEVDALSSLGEVNQELGRRCPDQRIATADQDATIIESHKQQALSTYEGERDRKTRSRCATWRFAFVRGRRNCLPTAAGRSILPC